MTGTRLWERIFAEKRALILPVAIGLGINLPIYTLAVYPQTTRIATATQRAEAAARARVTAERTQTEIRAMVAGKGRADQELEKFYTEVLPLDLSGARRVTYLRLAQLAERTNLRYERRTVRMANERESRLAKLDMTMVLAGAYEDVRRFIYELETASEFVVIEDVALAQGDEQNAPLVLTLQVATYYVAGGDPPETNGT